VVRLGCEISNGQRSARTACDVNSEYERDVKIENRRKQPRMAGSWPVTILTDRGPVQGEAKNISATGTYIQCSRRLLVEEIYPVYFGVDEESVVIRGRVVWTSLETSTNGFPYYNVGILFIR
jgi:hypothetical protein